MTTFNDFELPVDLKRAVDELGYESPTPIQEKTIPLLLGKDSDFLGIAATGTGKTAAFAIPLLARIKKEHRKTQSLIMAPTRELAKQISESIRGLGKYRGARFAVIYGGAGYREQMAALSQNPHIVIATPGRLLDHLDRGTIDLSSVSTVVLDEADEMISMGFKEDIEKVLEFVRAKGSNPNIWLFTATMQKELRRIADTFLKSPATAQVNTSSVLSGTVVQSFHLVREDDKGETVCRIVDSSDNFYGMIFCQTKVAVEEVASFLHRKGYLAAELHGDKTQREREMTMKKFRNREINIMVCTDVAARGLDVKNLTHVINYSVPKEIDSYIHRIGRTGRQGETGSAVSLVTPDRVGLIRRLEAVTGATIQHVKVPGQKQVVQRKISELVAKVLAVPEAKISKVVSGPLAEHSKSFDGLSSIEIAARFMNLYQKDMMSILSEGDGEGRDLNLEMRPEREFSRGRGFRGNSNRGQGGGRPQRFGGGGDRRPSAEGSKFRREGSRTDSRPKSGRGRTQSDR